MKKIANSKAWQKRTGKKVFDYVCGWCGKRFEGFETGRWEYMTCPVCGWEDCEMVVICPNMY